MPAPTDEKRERVVKAAVEWVYDQSCSNALVELEDAVFDFMEPIAKRAERHEER